MSICQMNCLFCTQQGKAVSMAKLHYEQLRHEYAGYSSVRLSNSYVHRLIFKEINGGIQIELLEIDETHYGNKR